MICLFMASVSAERAPCFRALRFPRGAPPRAPCIRQTFRLRHAASRGIWRSDHAVRLADDGYRDRLDHVLRLVSNASRIVRPPLGRESETSLGTPSLPRLKLDESQDHVAVSSRRARAGPQVVEDSRFVVERLVWTGHRGASGATSRRWRGAVMAMRIRGWQRSTSSASTRSPAAAPRRSDRASSWRQLDRGTLSLEPRQ